MEMNGIRKTLILSVVSAVICLPFGLVAIHYALKTIEYFVDNQPKLLSLNNMHAKRWAWSSIVAGLLFWGLTIYRLITT